MLENAPATPPSSANREAPPASSSWGSVVFAARVLTFTLIAAVLYWGKVVAIPLALAVLLSFILKPVVRALQRCRLPRAVAVIAAVSLACGILGGLGWVIGSQLAELTREIPQYRENVATKIRSVRSMMKGGTVEKLQGTVERLAAELRQEQQKDSHSLPAAVVPNEEAASSVQGKPEPLPVYVESPSGVINAGALAALLPIIDPLTTAALVLVLVVLMLLRWEDLRSRIISFSGHQNLSTATRACDDAGHRISRYLMIQLVLNGSYGLVFGIGLHFIGVPYAALWGLCGGLFRYLPYVGPVIGGALPVLISLITSSGWSEPLWVGGLILVMELVSNNALEPWLYGSNLGLSEVGLILAAVAWTFLWGPVGLLLATPLTVCLVVLGHYIPAFSIFAKLLSDAPVLAPPYRLYQRLLANDPREADEIVQQGLSEGEPLTVLDELMLPALALADRDQLADLWEDGVEERLAAGFKKLFLQVADEGGPGAATLGNTLRATVLIWPVTPMAECAAGWLRWMVRDLNAEVVVLSPETLAAEAAAEARASSAVLLCTVALSAAPGRRERQVAKRLADVAPETHFVAACLGSAAAPSQDARLPAANSAANLTVTDTLIKTCQVLRPLIQQAVLDQDTGEAPQSQQARERAQSEPAETPVLAEH